MCVDGMFAVLSLHYERRYNVNLEEKGPFRLIHTHMGIIRTPEGNKKVNRSTFCSHDVRGQTMPCL